MPDDKAKGLTARELIALERGDELEPVATCKDYLHVQNELLPCPFCGASVSNIEDEGILLCSGCGFYYVITEPIAEAIEHWNSRPIEDALRKEIAQLKKDKLEFNER